MPNLNKLFFLVMLLFNLAHAETISLDFKGATVVEVVQTLVKEILKLDYVIAPDVIQSDKRITVSVRQVGTDNLVPLIEGILKTVNVQMERRSDVYYIERLAPAQAMPQMQTQPAPVAAVPLPVPGQGVGQGVQPIKPKREVPDEIEMYRPKGKSVEFLAAVAKAAGADVIEFKGKAEQLVFSGTKEAMAKARTILAQVDGAPTSVNVRAVLVEFTTGNTESRSLQIALTALADKLGVVYQAGQMLTNAITFKNSTIAAAISAIDGDSRFKYVAEPSIRVLDGETAKLTVGQEVPTRGAISTDKNGNSQQSIDYRTAGVVLNLEPRVLDGYVQMKINQQISNFALTTTSNIDSPTILKREAQTTVSMKPGELIILAGMDEERTSASSSGLFFLPDFMRSRNSDNSRSQLVLLLEAMPEEIPPI